MPVMSFLSDISRVAGWVATAVVLVRLLVYVVAFGVALFHQDGGRRAEAKALLDRHFGPRARGGGRGGHRHAVSSKWTNRSRDLKL